MDGRIWQELYLERIYCMGGINMTIKEDLYNLFSLGFTDDRIQEYTRYDMDYIKQERSKYNNFTKEE